MAYYGPAVYGEIVTPLIEVGYAAYYCGAWAVGWSVA